MCDTSMIQAKSDSWLVNGTEVEYCLSRLEQPHCKIIYVAHCLTAILICSILKLMAMLYVLFFHDGEVLVKIGDAVASFLEVPDATSIGRCMTTRARIPSRNFCPSCHFSKGSQQGDSFSDDSFQNHDDGTQRPV